MIQTQENGKKPSFLVWIRPVEPKFGQPIFFLKNLGSSATRYYDKLSSCTISEKLTIQSWENLVTDGWTDRRTDGQMDKSDFIGRCPTNVEYPVKRSRHRNNLRNKK